MLILRLFLLAGLVFHKGVWIVMKRRTAPGGDSERPARSPLAMLAKAVKVTILALILVQAIVPRDILPLLGQSLGLRSVGVCLYALGLLVAVAGRIQLGGNWSDIEVGRIAERHAIVSTGVYGYIRHPIYVGDLLLLIGFELALNSWLVLAAVALVPPVLFRAVREERGLRASLPGYAEYARRTKRFIPFVA